MGDKSDGEEEEEKLPEQNFAPGPHFGGTAPPNLLEGSATEATTAAFESDKTGDSVQMEEGNSDNEDEKEEEMETNRDVQGDGHSSDESSADEKDEEEEEERMPDGKMVIGADELVANTDELPKQTEVDSEREEEEEEESMDMGSRPAGQTSLEIGSQDGAGETDEENGWPGPSHPLDRDREGVIETNMDQEEDN